MPDMKRRPCTAAEFRRANLVEVVVDRAEDGTERVFRMRRLSLADMAMLGKVPLPFLQAAQDFVGAGEAFRAGDVIGAEQVYAQHRDDLLAFAREFACAAVIEPRLVPDDTDDPNELWVGLLPPELLFSLLNAISPGTARLSGAGASSFRRPEPQSADLAGSTRTAVRDGAVDVAALAGGTVGESAAVPRPGPDVLLSGDAAGAGDGEARGVGQEEQPHVG